MCPRTPASSVFERPWFTGPGWLAWMPVVCVLLCPPPAAGQTASAATGVIGGVVTDATGGVLPGVNVTVTSSALMGARTTITSHTGAFRFAALPPGVYALAFACPGFAPSSTGRRRQPAVELPLGRPGVPSCNRSRSCLRESSG